MYITKEKLINMITELDTDCFDVIVDVTKPPSTHRLPDMRIGRSYPPQSHYIEYHTEPTKVSFSVLATIHHKPDTEETLSGALAKAFAS